MKVGHSKYFEMLENASDFYLTASMSDWYFIYTRHRVKIVIYLSNC